jgi:cytosine/adenosine deaminase-related metal-dependent hydrolase
MASAPRLLIEARNRTVGVAGGVIVEPDGRFDLVLRFPDGNLRPGLVNAHDHLHRNHYGRLGTPPYPDAYAWARDIQHRHRRAIARGREQPRRRALLHGAWKNLFAGVTTVVHHDPWEPDFDDGFPLSVVPIACADSLGMTPDLPGIAPGARSCIHLAEGVNGGAADEVRALAARGLLGPELVAVHVVGLDEAGVAMFRGSGAALVWCPSSNLFLFGRTAPAALLAEGVDVLLGSDSLLTGAGDLLDELRCARATGLVDDGRLEAAVGQVAARRLGLPPARLEPGEPADLVVLARPLLDASAGDVELVVARGVVRVAAPHVRLGALAGRGSLATLGGVSRWIDRSHWKCGETMNRSAPRPDLPHERTGLVNRE